MSYRAMTPQAMRGPEFPAGSVLSSSGSAWITNESVVLAVRIEMRARAIERGLHRRNPSQEEARRGLSSPPWIT
jgi:hypothetical protein